MNEGVLQRQTKLPKSIPLIRYAPKRHHFSLEKLDPASVKSVDDLPGYLLLGKIERTAFRIDSSGWQSFWKSDGGKTWFSMSYSADKHRYEFNSEWRGHPGPFATCSAKIPLGSFFSNFLTVFPERWDEESKSALEGTYQLTYLSKPQGELSILGIPDGSFKTIIVPIAAECLRGLTDAFYKVIDEHRPPYPVVVDAVLLGQVVNYVEGLAPSWSADSGNFLYNSFLATTLWPLGMPERVVAADGSSAWTIRRPIYCFVIGVPFVGLSDIISRLCSKNGPIRNNTGNAVQFDIRPIIVPSEHAYLKNSIEYWDNQRSAQCTLFFGKSDGNQLMKSALNKKCNLNFSGEKIQEAEKIIIEGQQDFSRILDNAYSQNNS